MKIIGQLFRKVEEFVYTFRKFWKFKKKCSEIFSEITKIQKIIHKFKKIGKFVKFFSKNSVNSDNFQRNYRKLQKILKIFFWKFPEVGSFFEKPTFYFIRKLKKNLENWGIFSKNSENYEIFLENSGKTGRFLENSENWRILLVFLSKLVWK